MTSHSYDLLNKVDRVVCRVIEGVPVDPKARENLICAREAIDRILDGRIAKDTDHLKLWGELNRIGRDG